MFTRKASFMRGVTVAGGGGSGTVLRSENFNRADGTISGSTPSDGGSPWSAGSGSIVSNQYKQTGISLLDAGASDVDVIATVTALPGGFGRMSLLARATDASNHWYFEVRCGSTPGASGGWSIQKKVAGVSSLVLSGTGPAFTVGTIFRLNAVGDQLRTYYTLPGGSETLFRDTGTGQTFNQTATLHGLGGANLDATARWDDLSIKVP